VGDRAKRRPAYSERHEQTKVGCGDPAPDAGEPHHAEMEFSDDRGSANSRSVAVQFAASMKSLGRGPGELFLSRAERGIPPEYSSKRGFR